MSPQTRHAQQPPAGFIGRPTRSGGLARGWIGALVLAVLAGSPLQARASSYLLESIPKLVSRAEVRRFYHAGVRTTDELIWHAATPAGRQELSRVSGIAPERLFGLASLSDLMRLRGVGPDAAVVISAAGCHSLTELQQADSHDLADAIRRMNDATHLTKNPPRADNLSAWIEMARRMPRLLQLDPPEQ